MSWVFKRRRHSFSWGTVGIERIGGRAWQGGARHLEGGFGSKEKEPREVPTWPRSMEWQTLTTGLNMPSKPACPQALLTELLKLLLWCRVGPFMF